MTDLLVFNRIFRLTEKEETDRTNMINIKKQSNTSTNSNHILLNPIFHYPSPPLMILDNCKTHFQQPELRQYKQNKGRLRLR